MREEDSTYKAESSDNTVAFDIGERHWNDASAPGLQ
jgi:hypothetical protein